MQMRLTSEAGTSPQPAPHKVGTRRRMGPRPAASIPLIATSANPVCGGKPVHRWAPAWRRRCCAQVPFAPVP
jgi:hypothetical protein